MTDLVRLGFGLVLLLMTLSIAMSFLAGPLAILRRTGALKAGKWLVRTVWRSLVVAFQLVTRTRRLHIMRPGTRPLARRVGQ